jgi:hypothetical protein
MSETEDYDKSATPTAHASTHENSGTDEISVDGLAGELVDDQPSTWTLVSGKPTTFAPEAHKTSHQDGGADEISVQGLSGTLGDPQTSTWALVSGKPTTFTPEAHKTSHQDGGADEISVQGLTGALGDAQTPSAHKTSHQDGGADEISVAGLSGELTDLQKPKDHTHQSAGSGVGGKIDHGLALDGLTDDDHTQYIKHALATAESDFLAASGAGAFVKKTLAETKTILGIPGAPDPGEGHITILPWHNSAVTQGTWLIGLDPNEICNCYFYNNTPAQNDQADYKVYLAAGTYFFVIVGYGDTHNAILTLLVDGVSVGTVDQYWAVPINNHIQGIDGIVIAAAGLKTISIKAATRNPSSDNWYLTASTMVLFRTA